MQNENWYVITTLVINILTAIGTVGAVIVSLWFAYKSHKREHRFLELISFANSDSEDYDISIACWFNNFCDKNIVVNSAWFQLNGDYGFHLSESYTDEYECRTIPAYARNHILFISKDYMEDCQTKEEYSEQKFNECDKQYRKAIAEIKKAKSIWLNLDTNIGYFDFKISKTQIKKLKEDIDWHWRK